MVNTGVVVRAAGERLRHGRAIEAVRDGEGESANVENHAGVELVTVAGVSSKEAGRWWKAVELERGRLRRAIAIELHRS